MDLKKLTRGIPQPYRGIVVRFAMIPLFPFALVYAAAYEGSAWLRESVGEYASAWRECARW